MRVELSFVSTSLSWLMLGYEYKEGAAATFEGGYGLGIRTVRNWSQENTSWFGAKKGHSRVCRARVRRVG